MKISTNEKFQPLQYVQYIIHKEYKHMLYVTQLTIFLMPCRISGEMNMISKTVKNIPPVCSWLPLVSHGETE